MFQKAKWRSSNSELGPQAPFFSDFTISSSWFTYDLRVNSFQPIRGKIEDRLSVRKDNGGCGCLPMFHWLDLRHMVTSPIGFYVHINFDLILFKVKLAKFVLLTYGKLFGCLFWKDFPLSTELLLPLGQKPIGYIYVGLAADSSVSLIHGSPP